MSEKPVELKKEFNGHKRPKHLFRALMGGALIGTSTASLPWGIAVMMAIYCASIGYDVYRITKSQSPRVG